MTGTEPVAYGDRLARARGCSAPVSTSQYPADKVTAVFARMADARYALGILETAGDAPIRATIEPVVDDSGNVRLVVLRVELAGLALDRIMAAVSGGHGVAVAEPQADASEHARIA